MKKVLAMIAMAIWAILPANAMAADTWLPDFNKNVHVHVDPQMKNRVNLDDDFEKEVVRKAETNNLNIYVVVTQAGDELSGKSRENWAPDMLHTRLWDRWQHESGFDESRILIILYIRSQSSNDGSIAVRSGSYLHGLGLDRSHFASSSGPVMPTAKNYMRSNPRTGFLTIIDNINAEITGGSKSPVSSFWSSPGLFGWPMWVWLVIVVVLVIAVIIFLVKLASSSGGGGGSGCSGSSSTFIYTSSSGSSCSSSSSSCGGGGGGCGGGGCGGGGGC